MIIQFYRTTEEYGFLSNFYQEPVYINTAHGGWVMAWHSEAIYQALKACPHQPRRALEILGTKSPHKAAQMGRDAERTKMRADWDEVRDDAMRIALKLKFAGGLWRKLLATDTAILVEHSVTDAYWGAGRDGLGRNRLGQLLMELRSRLIHEVKIATPGQDLDAYVKNRLTMSALHSYATLTGASSDELHVRVDTKAVNQYRLYTDGSSHARGEKPGGWAWIMVKWIDVGVHEALQLKPIHAAYGGDPSTTNNRMELTAILQGLSVLASGCCERGCLLGPDTGVEVVSDSQYALGIASGRFRPSRNGNLAKELACEWKRLREAGINVTFSWMRGHAGEAWNERVDGLAKLGKSMAEKKLAALKHREDDEEVEDV